MKTQETYSDMTVRKSKKMCFESDSNITNYFDKNR